MDKRIKQRVLRAALRARQRAVAPYSDFRVGAALLTKSGTIITGANVESASYGLTCCAERIAVFKALTEGQTRFEALAVAADCRGGPMPCGACRQILAEYGPSIKIWVLDSRRPADVREFRIADLLAEPFVGVPKRRGKFQDE
jgi:cytidine deaminase